MNNKPTLVKKSQGLISKLREARESGQGMVTYHFEEETLFNDYKGNAENNFIVKKEVGRKWSIQQPINNQLFINFKGKPESLEAVANILKDTAHDLGAKYFTI